MASSNPTASNPMVNQDMDPVPVAILLKVATLRSSIATQTMPCWVALQVELHWEASVATWQAITMAKTTRMGVME